MPATRTNPIYLSYDDEMPFGMFKGTLVKDLIKYNHRYLLYLIYKGTVNFPEELVEYVIKSDISMTINTIENDEKFYLDLTGVQAALIHNKSALETKVHTVITEPATEINGVSISKYLESSPPELDIRWCDYDFKSKLDKNRKVFLSNFDRAYALMLEDDYLRILVTKLLSTFKILDILEWKEDVVIIDKDNTFIQKDYLNVQTKALIILFMDIWISDLVIINEGCRLLGKTVIRSFLYGNISSVVKQLGKLVFIESSQIRADSILQDNKPDMEVINIGTFSEPILFYDHML